MCADGLQYTALVPLRTVLTISIVIPAFNEEKYISACLKSIAASKCKNVIETIVVDNASTDRTATVARNFPGVTVVREKKKGTSAARQRGFSTARGDIVAFVDADTQVSAEWFTLALKEFRKNKSMVCISGPYKLTDIPSWQRTIVDLYWQLLVMPAARIGGQVIVGGNFLVRRSALKRVGGFDTKLQFYGDDVEVARRLKKIGKIKFSMQLLTLSSGRRVAATGLLQNGVLYVGNYLSQMALKKPLTKNHKDFR